MLDAIHIRTLWRCATRNRTVDLPMRLIKALSFAILLSWLGLAGPANAFSCTATVTLNFGTVDLTEGLAIAGQGTVAVNCSGGGSGQVLRACPGIATPRQMTRSAGGQITYDLYSDRKSVV